MDLWKKHQKARETLWRKSAENWLKSQGYVGVVKETPSKDGLITVFEDTRTIGANMKLYQVKYSYQVSTHKLHDVASVLIPMESWNLDTLREKVQEFCTYHDRKLFELLEVLEGGKFHCKTSRKPSECPVCFKKILRTEKNKRKHPKAKEGEHRYEYEVHEKCSNLECSWEREYTTECIYPDIKA